MTLNGSQLIIQAFLNKQNGKYLKKCMSRVLKAIIGQYNSDGQKRVLFTYNIFRLYYKYFPTKNIKKKLMLFVGKYL